MRLLLLDDGGRRDARLDRAGPMSPDEYEILFGEPAGLTRGTTPQMVVELEPAHVSSPIPGRRLEEAKRSSIGYSDQSAGASSQTRSSTPQRPARNSPSRPNPWRMALAAVSFTGALFVGLLIAVDGPRDSQPQPCQEDVIYPAVLGTSELPGDSTSAEGELTTTTVSATSCDTD